MTNPNQTERPNRVVTCQICRVQMPQRYLAGHMKAHETAPLAALPVDPANQPEPEQTLDAPPVEDAAAGKQAIATLVCPACGQFVSEEDFANHMQAQHTNWCPLCHARATDLMEHLNRKHLLKPIQPPPLYERNWETQKRFICLGCKKKVSVWSYPKHEGPHGATRRLAQRIQKTRSGRVPRLRDEAGKPGKPA